MSKVILKSLIVISLKKNRYFYTMPMCRQPETSGRPIDRSQVDGMLQEPGYTVYPRLTVSVLNILIE